MPAATAQAPEPAKTEDIAQMTGRELMQALIDSATGCAAHSTLPAGFGIATIETKANFTRPINKNTGRVRAEARVTDSIGRVLAHGTSTVMVVSLKGEG